MLIILAYILARVDFYNNFRNNKKVIPTIKDTTENKTNKFNMKITSAAFEHNQKIPKKFTCDGEGFSPPLTFLDVPPDSKSLVLIVEDPDAPKGTFIHWVVYNINSNIKKVDENNVPKDGLEGITSIGKSGYVPPCPPASPKLQRGEPSGEHRYIFRLYALDLASLDLSGVPSKEEVEKAMRNHIIKQTELIGLYKR